MLYAAYCCTLLIQGFEVRDSRNGGLDCSMHFKYPKTNRLQIINQWQNVSTQIKLLLGLIFITEFVTWNMFPYKLSIHFKSLLKQIGLQIIVHVTKCFFPNLTLICVLFSSQNLLPILERLDLSYNDISQIEHLNHLSHLSHLDLSHNALVHVETLHSKLGNVRTLNLSGNKLKSLKGMSRLYSVVNLDVGNNCIEEVGIGAMYSNKTTTWDDEQGSYYFTV